MDDIIFKHKQKKRRLMGGYKNVEILEITECTLLMQEVGKVCNTTRKYGKMLYKQEI